MEKIAEDFQQELLWPKHACMHATNSSISSMLRAVILMCQSINQSINDTLM